MSKTAAGVQEHVDHEVLSFLRFARRKRLENLREVDGIFEDFMEDHVNEATYTADEVIALIGSLQRHVRTNVAAELQHVAHVTTVLLQQLHAQASKWYLRLASDLAQLDDASLLAAVAAFESDKLASASAASAASAQSAFPPPLESFSDESLGLLRNEIEMLKAKNAALAADKESLQQSLDDALRGTASEEGALAAAQKLSDQLREELAETKQMLARREAALAQADGAASHSAPAPSTSADSDEIARLQSELREAHANIRAKDLELAAVNAELDAKVSKTSPFISLKKMLRKKNDLIKSLRAQLESASGASS